MPGLIFLSIKIKIKMKIKMKMSSLVFVKRCPKGYTVYKNLESGLEDIFRKRDTTGKRNSVVYRA